jgi:hypothetical protein
VTPFEIAALVILTPTGFGLAWMERQKRRDDRALEAVRFEPAAALAALDELVQAKGHTAAPIRIYRRGSLGAYPEQQPGPGRLPRHRPARLVDELLTQLHDTSPGA